MRNWRVPIIIISLLAAAACSQALADTEPQVTICHATASASNPYTSNTVDQSSIDDPNGHGTHPGDIIPAFDGYPGQNLDLLDILNNGCEVPPPPTTVPPPTTTEPPVTTEPPSTTEPPPTTEPPCGDECVPPPPPPPPPPPVVPPIDIVHPCSPVFDLRPGCHGPVTATPSQTG